MPACPLRLEPARRNAVATRNAKAKKGVRVPLQHCVYCGAWSYAPVCRAHTDLLFLDQKELEKRP